MPKMQKIKIQNANSIEKSIQYFEIGCIQFNKIFIQLGNSGFDQRIAREFFERVVLSTPILLTVSFV